MNNNLFSSIWGKRWFSPPYTVLGVAHAAWNNTPSFDHTCKLQLLLEGPQTKQCVGHNLLSAIITRSPLNVCGFGRTYLLKWLWIWIMIFWNKNQPSTIEIIVLGAGCNSFSWGTVQSWPFWRFDYREEGEDETWSVGYAVCKNCIIRTSKNPKDAKELES